MTDVIAMSQSCSRCGTTVTNDETAIRHPLEFLDALRARGWSIPAANGVHHINPRCPKCASLS